MTICANVPIMVSCHTTPFHVFRAEGKQRPCNLQLTGCALRADDFLSQHIVKFNQIMRDLAVSAEPAPAAPTPAPRGVPAY